MSNPSPRYRWRTALLKPGGPPSTSRLVGCALAEHMDDRGIAYPSADLLADETGLSERAVRTHLDTLERHGWLTCLARGGTAGGPRTSRWQATTPEGRSDITSEPRSEPHPRYQEGRSEVAPPTPERPSTTPEGRSDEPGKNLKQAAAAAAAPMTRVDILDIATSIVIGRRGTVAASKTKRQPERWLHGAAAGIKTEVAEVLNANPTFSPQQIANALSPIPDNTALDELVANADDHSACTACDQHGWITQPDDTVLRCDGPHHQEHPAA